jgi:FixJ family two-component response regulator
MLFGSAEEFLESGILPRATCVIADIRLPGLHGLELQRRIRQQRARTPIIFITAHDDVHTRDRIAKSGAVGHLQKPFDEHVMLDAIHRAIQAKNAPAAATLSGPDGDHS